MCTRYLTLLYVITIVLRNMSLSMCFLALPTFQSDWYNQRPPLSEHVLRQQGTWVVM